MCAKSKTLSLVLLPALLLAMLVFVSFSALPTHSAFAAEKSVERIGCDRGRQRCEARCEATMIDVGHQIDACKRDCQREWLNCLPLGETPDAPKAPLTKVQPKVQPGGAETPGTESPNVQPKGGIQRE
jgi:hypothetical protein